jgi:hypothetical protein
VRLPGGSRGEQSYVRGQLVLDVIENLGKLVIAAGKGVALSGR